jgi:glutaconate CoA-transferase subunit A
MRQMTQFVTIPEAAEGVTDGSYVGMASGMPPMALLREIVRRGVRDLRLVVVPSGGLQADFLIGAGCVASLESSAMSLGEEGFAPNFRRAFVAGRVKSLETT